MNEQELNEARTLIVEVRAMLKAGAQAVQDLRDLHARFENQAGAMQMAPAAPDGQAEQIAALEEQVQALAIALDQKAQTVPDRFGALEAQMHALTLRLDQPGENPADRLAAVETEMRRAVQQLELRATSALTALNLRAGGAS